MSAPRLIGVSLLVISATCVTACRREVRAFRPLPAATAPAHGTATSELRPGVYEPPPEVASPFLGNAQGLAEGKRLYESFNCVGCHAHGGGAIGPPLMDDKWIYGGRPAEIFDTIVHGRPNGMPSFAGRLSDAQIWQIVAYVQSMSGQAPKDAAPGRSDHMAGISPESSREPAPPVMTGSPQ